MLLTNASTLIAEDVAILSADFLETEKNTWSVNITLKHADSGWQHYADRWRIVDSGGQIFGERVLLHPHVNEQPFTRALNGILIPETAHIIYIEVHDSKHGWSDSKLEIDIDEIRGD